MFHLAQYRIISQIGISFFRETGVIELSKVNLTQIRHTHTTQFQNEAKKKSNRFRFTIAAMKEPFQM